MGYSKDEASSLVLSRTIRLDELNGTAAAAIVSQFAEELRAKLPPDADILLLAVGLPSGEADRLRDALLAAHALLRQIDRPVEQEPIAKLIEALLPPMAPPHPVVLEAAMLARAKSRILLSRNWVPARDIAELDQLSEPDAVAQADHWKRDGQIFALRHEGVDYFPLYGLEHNPIRPLPAMKPVLDALGAKDPWQVAFWFDSVNSYLGGRSPQEVIASEPDQVVAAAMAAANWESNG